MIEYTFKYWKDSMSDFCSRNNGTGEVVKRPSMGQVGEYYIYNGLFFHKKNKIHLQQGIVAGSFKEEEIGFWYFTLECEIDVNMPVFIYLNHRDWWDRLFSNKSVTGNPSFDKIFVVQSSEPELGVRIFSNTKIAEMFIHNEQLVLNVNTRKNTMKIMLKDLRHKLYTEQEMSDMMFCIRFVIDCIYSILK